MESVEWIFTDHKLHLSMLQLLQEEQSCLAHDGEDKTNRDDEISGILKPEIKWTLFVMFDHVFPLFLHDRITAFHMTLR